MDFKNQIKNRQLADWIQEVIQLCKPQTVHVCDGSEQEYHSLCRQLVEEGTLVALNPEKRPGCFLARTHPSDVARVEERTLFVQKHIRRRAHQSLGRPR